MVDYPSLEINARNGNLIWLSPGMRLSDEPCSRSWVSGMVREAPLDMLTKTRCAGYAASLGSKEKVWQRIPHCFVICCNAWHRSRPAQLRCIDWNPYESILGLPVVTLPKASSQLRRGISFFEAREEAWQGKRLNTLPTWITFSEVKTCATGDDNDEMCSKVFYVTLRIELFMWQ